MQGQLSLSLISIKALNILCYNQLQIYFYNSQQIVIIMFNLFRKQEKSKQINKEEIKKQSLSALNRVCPICNSYSVQKVTFGEDVEPKLTCKKCQLKALGNDPSKLANNLITVEAFSQSLSKEITEYYHIKNNVTNLNKANITACNEHINKTINSIAEIKENMKNLKKKSNQKLLTIVSNTDTTNKITIFQKLQDLSSNKKLDQISNGKLLINEAIVTNELHFYDEEELNSNNKKITKQIEKVEQILEFDFDDLRELIRQINKITV